jgi:quinol-cytochrome oxidoreductase complex cytochrome b subunit
MPGRLRSSVADVLGQLWADVKASTDSSLLEVGRWLGLLRGPIDRRLPIDQALKKAMTNRLPAHIRWKHVFGSITYLLFAVLVVTGVLLSFYYRPSAQEAYPSIQHIVSGVSFGWLIRDVHVWSASLIVIVMLAHLARVFIDMAYKPPRETNWLIGMLLLLVVLAFGATGYLLPWDQWSYWAAVEVLATYNELPIVGPFLTALLTGDVMVSGATLSRYFALHVIVLPWVAFGLLAFHFGLARRHGIAPPKDGVQSEEPGRPFYPNHLLRNFVTAVVVITLVITFAVLWPRPVGDPATPYDIPSELVTTWAPVNIALATVRYLGPWGVVGFVVLGIALVFLPLFDRDPNRMLRRQPVVLALGIVLFISLVGAWAIGSQIDSVNPAIAPTVQAPGEVGTSIPDLRTSVPDTVVAPAEGP